MIAIQTIEATKGFDQTNNGGRVTITPRFNIPSKERDVMIQYTLAKTNLKLVAPLNSDNVNNQIVTISQQIDANNRIAPTLDSQGNVSVEWERTISEDSTLIANIDAKQLSLQWRDAAWNTNIRIPIDGSHSIHGANVSIQRDVSF